MAVRTNNVDAMWREVPRGAVFLLLWLGCLASGAASSGATTPTPLMPCCTGSACCGPTSQPCQLSYGASGTLVDARSGEPIAGAQITVADLTTTSNTDGSWGAFGFRPDTCAVDYFVPVSVAAHGYAPFSDSLYTSMPLRHIDVQLEPLDSGTGYTINGTVAESPPCEGGVSGVTVVLEPLGLRTETATADAGLPTGFFAFTNVPPGDYTLRAEPTCNLYGCWDPQPVHLSTSDFGASLCQTLRPDALLLSVADVTGAPGDRVLVDVTLHSRGAPADRVAVNVSFEPEAAIAIADDGGPACEAVAAVAAAAFAWAPAGCAPGIDCTAVQADVQLGAAPPADGAVLFRCAATITDQPGNGCYHLLRCRDLIVSEPSGAPLDAMCEHGSVESRSPIPGLSYDFTVTPAQPIVGDHVEVSVDVNGYGGLPTYRLSGARPPLDGATSLSHSGPVSGTVTFALDAVASGTASLVLSVNYETEFGCPGNTGFGFTNDRSEPFLVEIGAPGSTPVPSPSPTPTTPAPPCPTGTPVFCPSGQTPRCFLPPGNPCEQCTCEPCPACPTGEIFAGNVNSCTCVIDTTHPPNQNGGGGGGGCAIAAGSQDGGAIPILVAALLAIGIRMTRRRA